jgi:cytochrome c oxidase accessory protein FixG
MCVQTCPTGIDIRNGLQMECINCAQCIDACNAVMRKLNRPEGLIRYSSQAAMSGETRKFIRPRVVLYPLLLSVVLSGFLIVLLGKPPADITLIHTRGQTYVPLEGGLVGNHARVKIVNRTETPQVYTLGAEGEGGPGLRAQSNPATLLPGEMREIPVVLTLPVDRFERGKADIRVTVTSEAGYSRSVAYQLKGPANSAAMEAVRATGRPAEPRSEPGVGPAKEDER